MVGQYHSSMVQMALFDIGSLLFAQTTKLTIRKWSLVIIHARFIAIQVNAWTYWLKSIG